MFSTRNFVLKIPKSILPILDISLVDFDPRVNINVLKINQPNNWVFELELEWTLWLPTIEKILDNFFEKSYFQVKTPFAPLRKNPNHSSEMISQLLCGEIFVKFFEIDNFAYGYSDDGYLGYVSTHQIHPFQKRFFRSYQKHFNYPLGSKILSEEVCTPSIQELADMLLGTPYLWGGRSNWGIDCSGLTQLLMYAKNISLPRDAYQQADFGVSIPYGSHSFGDLAFFGKSPDKITHVGFLLNENEILHAYGEVRKDLFNKMGIYHTDYKQITHELVAIKRYPLDFHFLQFLQSQS
jgi:hypothetical protein